VPPRSALRSRCPAATRTVVFTDADDRDEPSAYNTFNAANEWTARRIAKAGTDRSEFTYTHDPVGNLIGESVTTYTGSSTAVATRGWVYDPFGRLVRTTGLARWNPANAITS
jgi:hypothetical protein